MPYTTEDIINKLPISSEDLEQYIKSTGIKVTSDGKLSNKSFQAIITFYENTIKGNGRETIDINKENAIFQTSDNKN